jgi:hypothetical protein
MLLKHYLALVPGPAYSVKHPIVVPVDSRLKPDPQEHVEAAVVDITLYDLDLTGAVAKPMTTELQHTLLEPLRMVMADGMAGHNNGSVPDRGEKCSILLELYRLHPRTARTQAGRVYGNIELFQEENMS